MTGRLGLVVAGLCCLLAGYRLTVVPLAPDAPELKGWLFREFGQQGVAIGSAVLGVLMVGLGLMLAMRTLHRARRRRALRGG